MPRPPVVCLSIALGLAWSSPCRAGDEAAPPASAEEAKAPDALPVTIKLVSTPIQSEAIRAAIEAELKVSVRIEDVAVDEGLSVTVKWRRVTVSYRSKQREATTRSLDLPANSEQAVEVIALLAGNLARDEASELLARLAPPPGEPAPTEAASPEAASPEPTPPAEQPKTEPPAAAPAKVPEQAKKPAAPKQRLDGLIPGKEPVVNVTLFYPATLLQRTERRAINIEAGFAYSRVGAVEGGGFTLGYLRVEKDARGAVGSFGWTRVGGDAHGIQWGGLVSEGHGKIRGADLGDIAALRWGNVDGVQGSAFFSLAKNVRGAQTSAGVAVADDVEGGQVSLIAVARDVKGAQLNLVGVARDIDGGQAGLVNVAKSADVQIGLVNVAERIDGASIGLVNIAGNGYVEPTAYVIAGAGASYNAGVKFVAGLAYSVLAGGVTQSGGAARARTEVGGGLHVEPPLFRSGPVVDRTALEIGAHAGHAYLPKSEQASGDDDRLHYRAGMGFRFFRAVWLFAGYDVSNDFTPFGENVGQGPWAGVAVF